jgi:hypothetical protein
MRTRFEKQFTIFILDKSIKFIMRSSQILHTMYYNYKKNRPKKLRLPVNKLKTVGIQFSIFQQVFL